ncbi:MAG: dienelactone hydrolase family protein, partial [Myxococcota bacterium]|nr:dienelactone hydrolase family protein [Myxococcota bacterium]
LLVIPSIFGLDEDLTLLCEDIAFEGFTVIAVDPFWEIDPGPLGHSIQEVRRALARKNDMDKDEALENVFAFCKGAAAYAENICILGIGYGGLLAFQALAHRKATAAVTWHAAGITDHLTLVDKVSRPLSLHFGANDAMTPPFEIEILQKVFQENEKVDIVVYPDAKHGYSFRDEMTYSEEAFDGSYATLLQVLQKLS